MRIKAEKTLKVPIVYSDSYYVEVGDHVFPTSKYRILKKMIDSENSLIGKFTFVDPGTVSDDVVRNVHTKEYVHKLRTATLSSAERMTLELPFSKSLVEVSFTSCSGTITAARSALTAGGAVHLGGGFHHAFPDHGEGFCVLNDIAVAVRALQSEGAIERALIVDCDLHQGNGTAWVFEHDPTVFTFSIHQEHTYPFVKERSDLDIGLKDYTGDKEYLEHLYDRVPKLISSFKPDIIVYVAGADPYVDDQLGKLSLSKEGLRERDNFVCTQAKNFDIPIVVVLAGGYACKREDTVAIHYGTVEECMKVFSGK